MVLAQSPLAPQSQVYLQACTERLSHLRQSNDVGIPLPVKVIYVCTRSQMNSVIIQNMTESIGPPPPSLPDSKVYQHTIN